MVVKEKNELIRDLDRIVETATRAKELASESSAMTVTEMAKGFGISESALIAFVETLRELMGGRPIDPPTARRAAMIVAADQIWENELGPLLSSAQVRELLGGVSRQGVDERLKSRRLIGLRDSGGRWRFPVFQFVDGQPLPALVDAFWTLADSTISGWTAASWCVEPDDALESRSPLQWVRSGEDAERLKLVARQDAARLSR
jgi:hypothetical protein